MRKLARLEHLLDAFAVEGKRVLDAGTGVGVGALALLRKGAASIVSVSIRPSDMEQARKQIPELRDGRVEFRCANLSDLSAVSNGEFDFCLADHLLSAVDALTPGEHASVVSEIYRVLRPGGTLAAVDTNTADTIGQSEPLIELAELWRTITLKRGDHEYGSYSPQWVSALLEGVGFSVDAPLWLGSEPRDVHFVAANEEGLRRAINGLPQDARESLESQRVRVVERLRAALPLRGPRVYAVCAEKPAG